MLIGERIKRVRKYRGLTQKDLGVAVGLDEKSADIRIAQYESGARKPKEELLREMARVLDVSYYALADPIQGDATELLHLLFYLDETVGVDLHEVPEDPDGGPGPRTAISFRYGVLESFMKEWKKRQDELNRKEITRQEYMAWKLNWPETADNCGKIAPKRDWRMTQGPRRFRITDTEDTMHGASWAGHLEDMEVSIVKAMSDGFMLAHVDIHPDGEENRYPYIIMRPYEPGDSFAPGCRQIKVLLAAVTDDTLLDGVSLDSAKHGELVRGFAAEITD